MRGLRLRRRYHQVHPGCCLRYELLPALYGHNSNSTVYTAMLRCIPMAELMVADIEDLLPPDPPPLGAPGWGVEIPAEECDCP